MTEHSQDRPTLIKVALGSVLLAILIGAPLALSLARVRGSGGQGPWAGRPCRSQSDALRLDIDGDHRDDWFTLREVVPEPWDATSAHDELWSDTKGWWKFDECDVLYRVQLGNGDTIDQRAGDTGFVPDVMGPTDLDGGGVPEVWLAGGMSSHILTFDSDGRVTPVGTDDYRQAEVAMSFESWGIGGRSFNFDCVDLDGDDRPEIVQLEQEEVIPGQPNAEREYWAYEAYSFDGTKLALVRERNGDRLAERPRNIQWESLGRCFPIRPGSSWDHSD